MSFELEITSLFEPEDWAWLKREAARRKVEIKDIINDLMPEIDIRERISAGEFAACLERAMFTAVRKARMGVQ